MIEIFNIINEETRAKVEDPVSKVLREGKVVGLANHTVLVRKDGGEIPIDDSGAPIRDRDGKILGAVLVFHDIIKRKQAEANQDLMTGVLKILNRGGDLHTLIDETLRTVRDVTGFDAVGLRLRQGEDCPYYECDGFTEEFRREENFLCARSGDGAIIRDAEDRVVLECTCGLVLSGRIDSSLPCFTKGGSFWTNASHELLALPPEADPRTHPRNRCIHAGYESVGLFPIRSGTEIIGLMQLNDRRGGRINPEQIAFYESMAQNIGLALQRAEAEEALRDADRRKDEFLAMLAHELRNPLAPVRYAVQIMNAACGTECSKLGRIVHQRDIIERQIGHMARLIEDLLDVARVATGKIVLHKEMIDLVGGMRQSIDSCRQAMEHKRQELNVSLPEEPMWLEGDLTRLVQVFTNLLGNAIKYSLQSRRIWVSVIPEQSEANGTVAVVRVRDEGEGISPNLLTRVFDLFTQGERGKDRAQGGLGIGLTMVQKLIELHGGTVEARSKGAGKGSEFVVRLPLVETESNGTASREAPPTLASRSLKILTVDDVADSAESLAELLGMFGHQTRVAFSGSTALDIAREWRPEVVLLDIGMPGMDGYEVTRRLRSEHGKNGMTIIALTGYGQESDRLEGQAAGFNDHLVKPVDINALRVALEKIPAHPES